MFEETDASSRPTPACTDVANWITSDSFDPWGLDYGTYSLESANLPASSVSPSEIRAALFVGSLVSFNMVSDEGKTLCSFVSTWDAPMKSSWIVETPPLTPIGDTPADAPCDNGWAGSMAECEAEEDILLQAAEPEVPPQDTSDLQLDPDYIIYVDP
ncbi:MAG: hypothetical protein E6J90_28695 [Deltaproteobacteria bacterium]|nr:MAG: hypothetical protein E6J91_40335 [Deltaproteobacteria bacterium]TMQ13395.1 MAG: hypothetical protein E6J90_28695 [Deltaproteobacteria bacterium]